MKSILNHKRGSIGDLQGIVMTLVVLGILLGVGFLVLESFRDQIEDTASEGANASSYEGVNETINALTEVPSWLSIIIIIAIVGILLAIVFSVLPRASSEGAS
ncbi:MAG: hypothetical protein ACTSVB_04455 [Candidatus Heimdallarchaeaceae archaeon]